MRRPCRTDVGNGTRHRFHTNMTYIERNDHWTSVTKLSKPGILPRPASVVRAVDHRLGCRHSSPAREALSWPSDLLSGEKNTPGICNKSWRRANWSPFNYWSGRSSRMFASHKQLWTFDHINRIVFQHPFRDIFLETCSTDLRKNGENGDTDDF